jgi:hypothetical protein
VKEYVTNQNTNKIEYNIGEVEGKNVQSPYYMSSKCIMYLNPGAF